MVERNYKQNKQTHKQGDTLGTKTSYLRTRILQRRLSDVYNAYPL